MSLFFLDWNFHFNLKSQKDKLFCKVQDHCFVTIDILSDGDVLEITSGSMEYDFQNILNWLSEQNATIL